MKARVKATGEIVDETAMVSTLGDDFYLRELEPISEGAEVIDYWTRLEHQAAIAAMPGMLAGAYYQELPYNRIVEDAQYVAHALVEKLKEEEKKRNEIQ